MKTYQIFKTPRGLRAVVSKDVSNNRPYVTSETYPTQGEINAAVENFTATAVNFIPPVIQNWRAKAVLSLNGLLISVQEAIDALPEPQKTIVKTAWEGNADLSRNGETVTAIAAACNLSDEQLDDLFIEAAKLRI